MIACYRSRTFGWFPCHLLISTDIFHPGDQHGPLDHGEIICEADDPVSLQLYQRVGNGPQSIETYLAPEEGPKRLLPCEKSARDKRGEKQERSDEPQQLMTRQLEGKSAIPELIQHIQIGHEGGDSPEEGPDPSGHLKTRRHDCGEFCARCWVRD